jgi:hypothetical protein
MNIALNQNLAHLTEGLDDEAKFELLEHLAEELGFDLSEQAEAVNPQSDILDVIEGAIRNLEEELSALKTQFAEGAELEYETLDQASENIESIVSELFEAHGSLNTLIDSEFDVDDDEEEEE